MVNLNKPGRHRAAPQVDRAQKDAINLGIAHGQRHTINLNYAPWGIVGGNPRNGNGSPDAVLILNHRGMALRHPRHCS